MPLRILLVDTKQPRDTKRLVAGVGARTRQFPAIMQPTLTALHALALQISVLIAPTHAAAITALAEADPAAGTSTTAAATAVAPTTTTSSASATAVAPDATVADLATLVTLNHALMNALGVGHPALDRVFSLAAGHQWAAKLTGTLLLV